MTIDLSNKVALALHISSCRWLSMYIGMDNYMSGWTTGDVDFY